MSEGEHYDPFQPHLHGKPEGLIGKKPKEPELTTTEKLLTQIAEKGEREEGEKKLNPRKRIEAEARRIKEENNRPEAWLTLVLGETAKAEARSEKDRHRSDEDDSIWAAVEDVIEEIPDGLGALVTSGHDELGELANYTRSEHPEGLYLKDRLKIYFNARRHLNDRYIEISRADGSLTAMGLGKEDVPFEGIAYKVQKVDPIDWWSIYHGDEMFPEVDRSTLPESSELMPRVDRASEAWLEVGLEYKKLPEGFYTDQEKEIWEKISESDAELSAFFGDKYKGYKELSAGDLYKFYIIEGKGGNHQLTEKEVTVIYETPTFLESRNSADKTLEIRGRIRQADTVRSGKAEDLAFRALTVSLTMPLLDRDRKSVQGSSQDRDLMWGERARIFNFGEKEREPGVDWTVGRYFVKPGQEDEIQEKIERGELEDSAKIRRRESKLKINKERGVLEETPGSWEGEVVSDFFHSFVFVQDQLTGKDIRRTLVSYVVNADRSIRIGGFRQIPFLKLGQNPYQGYFGYTLGKAKQIDGEMSGTTWQKPEELMADDFWNKRRDLFARLEHVSPCLVDREFRFRGKLVRDLLVEQGYDPALVGRILGFSQEIDLVEVVPDRNERLVLINLMRRNDIAGTARKLSNEYLMKVTDKMRMVHAMGVIWPGSLDALEGTSTLFTASVITPDMLRKIILAIQASNYLTGEYLEQFKYEAWQEMDFGEKWASKRKKRYRI